MNCFNHPDVTGVATCKNCNKVLCKTCADEFETPICVNCNKILLKDERKKIIKEFIFMVVFGFIFMSVNSNGISPVLSIVAFYYGAALVAGFNKFRQNSKTTIIIGNVWVILGYIIAAMFVGVFIAPFRIINNFKRLNIINDTLQHIDK